MVTKDIENKVRDEVRKKLGAITHEIVRDYQLRPAEYIRKLHEGVAGLRRKGQIGADEEEEHLSLGALYIHDVLTPKLYASDDWHGRTGLTAKDTLELLGPFREDHSVDELRKVPNVEETLQALEKKGFVSHAGQPGKPSRYFLTKAGTEKAADLMARLEIDVVPVL